MSVRGWPPRVPADSIPWPGEKRKTRPYVPPFGQLAEALSADGWAPTVIERRYWVGGEIRTVTGPAQGYVAPRDYPSPRLRQLCGEQNHRCCYCGITMVWERDHKHMATIDHVVPVSKGGPKRAWENLVAACARCNNGKKDGDALDYFFLCICGMTPNQWSNWQSVERKRRRRAQIEGVFRTLGYELEPNGRLPDHWRSYWPKAKKRAKRVPVAVALIRQPGIT